MARHRTLDREALLDAAEATVAERGAANMTIEAVAKTAGMSKASVLYDYGTKQALIEAVVKRALSRDNAFNEEMTSEVSAIENRVILGRIAAARAAPPPEAGSPALNLVAALAQDASLRSLVQENQAKVITLISDDSRGRRGAILAYVALEGLKLLEHLDFHKWNANERERLLKEIGWLVNQNPPEEDDL